MTTPKLRLLFSSNILGCPSGYGVQAGSLLPRLAELSEYGGTPGTWDGRANIAQHAWYGLEGLTLTLDGIKIYPRFDDPYGNDVLGAHTKHFGANLVISLIDVWVLRQPAQQVAPSLFCPWLPIDHDPVPQQFLDALAGAHLPLTYAKWGHDMLARAGVANEYIPHGIEPSVYRVNPDRDEVRAFKKWLTGSDETFLMVMVAANKGFPDRKWFQGQLEAARDFAKDIPNWKLYIHSLSTPVHGGVDFATIARNLGMEGRLIFPHPYLYRLGYPPEHLALVYNAADVLLGASMSEGFGIPLIEAQACGCPVVTTNFSAMPELVRWGHIVDVDHLVMTGMHSYQAWPSKRSMTDKLQRLYEAWLLCGGEWPMSKRLETQNAIHAEYSWDVIVRDQWAPLMARLSEAAPPLERPMQAQGVDIPQPPQDEMSAFVEAVNEGLQEESKPKVITDANGRTVAVVLPVNEGLQERKVPRRRVAPLTPITPKEAHAIMDEVALDNLTGEHRTLDEMRAAVNRVEIVNTAITGPITNKANGFVDDPQVIIAALNGDGGPVAEELHL